MTVDRRRDRARRRTQRERQLAAAGAGVTLLAVAVLLLTHLGGSDSAAGGASSGRDASLPPRPPQLPRGGRVVLPKYRVVALYGAPQDGHLGELGIGTPQRAAAKLAVQALPYQRPNRPVMPAFELIATLVTAAPGDDGRYRYRQSGAVIDRYLAAARRAKALLILDIQPGRAQFMDEVRAYRRYLVQPDVELALDPEWSMRPGEVPGRVIGSTDAAVVNQAAAYLAQLESDNDLPQKLLLVHQFTTGEIQHKRLLTAHDGVALVINIDGFGDRANKISKYHLFARPTSRWFNGFKLFYHEDTNLLPPRDVLKLRPQPNVVVYE
ncbi:MAG: hypothetical protein QOG33_1677 [Gaiellales bacterium]|nr:hypothetical protein [Gaiellales bacterium]